MSSNHEGFSMVQGTRPGTAGQFRKPYHKPQLEELGDLRTLTLGGSPGAGDSGGAFGVEILGSKGDIRLPPPDGFSY